MPEKLLTADFTDARGSEIDIMQTSDTQPPTSDLRPLHPRISAKSAVKYPFLLIVGRILDFLCGARPPRRRVPASPRRSNQIIPPCSSTGCSPQAACPKCPIYVMNKNAPS